MKIKFQIYPLSNNVLTRGDTYTFTEEIPGWDKLSDAQKADRTNDIVFSRIAFAYEELPPEPEPEPPPVMKYKIGQAFIDEDGDTVVIIGIDISASPNPYKTVWVGGIGITHWLSENYLDKFELLPGTDHA